MGGWLTPRVLGRRVVGNSSCACKISNLLAFVEREGRIFKLLKRPSSEGRRRVGFYWRRKRARRRDFSEVEKK